jgi:hypothetical protein
VPLVGSGDPLFHSLLNTKHLDYTQNRKFGQQELKWLDPPPNANINRLKQ